MSSKSRYGRRSPLPTQMKDEPAEPEVAFVILESTDPRLVGTEITKPYAEVQKEISAMPSNQAPTPNQAKAPYQRGIVKVVAAYLYALPNEAEVTVEEIIKSAYPVAISARQITNAVSYLARGKNNLEIVTLVQGRRWQVFHLHDVKPATTRVKPAIDKSDADTIWFREIGTTKAGDLLVEDAGGILYKVVAL